MIMNFEHNFILFNDYLRVKASDRVIMRLTAANDIKTPSQAIGNVAWTFVLLIKHAILAEDVLQIAFHLRQYMYSIHKDDEKPATDCAYT